MAITHFPSIPQLPTMKKAKGKKKGNSAAPALERILGYAGSDVEAPVEESEEEEEEEDEENKVRASVAVLHMEKENSRQGGNLDSIAYTYLILCRHGSPTGGRSTRPRLHQAQGNEDERKNGQPKGQGIGKVKDKPSGSLIPSKPQATLPSQDSFIRMVRFCWQYPHHPEYIICFIRSDSRSH